MKKVFTYISIIAAAAFMTFSCSKENEYVPAKLEGEQFYFPVSVATSYTITESTTAFEIDVMRSETSGASTVTVAVTDTSKTVFSEGSGSLTASFEDGKNKTSVSLPIAYDNFKYGDLFGLDVAISGDKLYPYAPTSLHIEIALPEPWTNLGKGTLVDDVVCGLYGIDPVAVPCTVYKNDLIEGLYKIADYQVPLVAAIFEESEEKVLTYEGTYWRATELLIDATDPTDVRIELQDYGVCINSSDGFIDGVTSVYKGEPFSVGTLENGIISFPTPKGMLCTLNGDGYYYADQNGKFAIALPGYTIADYSIAVSYEGLYSSKDGSVSAVADVTFGADVESAKAVIVAGEDLEAAIALIQAGDESVVDVASEGEIQLALPELDETYSIVVVSVAGDELQEAAFDIFSYKDFSIAISASDPVTNPDGATGTLKANLVFGEDVDYAKAVLFNKAISEITEEDLAIFDGDDPSVITVKDAAEELSFQLPAEGKYTIVAVSYASEQKWNTAASEIEFVLVSPWDELGQGALTDDIACSLYDMDPVTVTCTVFENNQTPGLYKVTGFQLPIVAAAFGQTEETMAAYEGVYWRNSPLVIDATDPTNVKIELQDYGVCFNTSDGFVDGVTSLYKGEPFSVGTLENGVISFPTANGMLCTLGGEGYYYADANGLFKVVLPSAAVGLPKPASVKNTGSLKVSAQKLQVKGDLVSISRGKIHSTTVKELATL